MGPSLWIVSSESYSQSISGSQDLPCQHGCLLDQGRTDPKPGTSLVSDCAIGWRSILGRSLPVPAVQRAAPSRAAGPTQQPGCRLPPHTVTSVVVILLLVFLSSYLLCLCLPWARGPRRTQTSASLLSHLCVLFLPQVYKEGHGMASPPGLGQTHPRCCVLSARFCLVTPRCLRTASTSANSEG